MIQLYSKGNQLPYLGSDSLRDWAYKQRDISVDELVIKKQAMQFRPSIAEFIDRVSTKMKVPKTQILNGGCSDEKSELSATSGYVPGSSSW